MRHRGNAPRDGDWARNILALPLFGRPNTDGVMLRNPNEKPAKDFPGGLVLTIIACALDLPDGQCFYTVS